jgi:predicted TIM-barrel fold metal-dependent hydrolase
MKGGFMRVITLEDHITTPMAKGLLPPDTEARKHHRAEMNKRLGFDSEAALLEMGPQRIAAMDAAGIDFQVMSLTAPGAQGYDEATSRELACDANDRMAAAVKAYPKRLGGFAAIPTPDPAAAAKELERAVKQLGLLGALINGHTRGSFLDDRKYWVIFEAAQAMNVPIYLHPTRPQPSVMKAYFEDYSELAGAAWGFAADTGAHYLRLIFAGIYDTFPDLKIIVGHLGEGLPFCMQRLNLHCEMDAAHRGLKKSPLRYLRENMLVTSSGNFSIPAFMCTYMEMGADNLMFSVDWPYEKNSDGTEMLKHLPISPQDLAKVSHLNAERILNLKC